MSIFIKIRIQCVKNQIYFKETFQNYSRNHLKTLHINIEKKNTKFHRNFPPNRHFNETIPSYIIINTYTLKKSPNYPSSPCNLDAFRHIISSHHKLNGAGQFCLLTWPLLRGQNKLNMLSRNGQTRR